MVKEWKHSEGGGYRRHSVCTYGRLCDGVMIGSIQYAMYSCKYAKFQHERQVVFGQGPANNNIIPINEL